MCTFKFQIFELVSLINCKKKPRTMPRVLENRRGLIIIYLFFYKGLICLYCRFVIVRSLKTFVDSLKKKKTFVDDSS